MLLSTNIETRLIVKTYICGLAILMVINKKIIVKRRTKAILIEYQMKFEIRIINKTWQYKYF